MEAKTKKKALIGSGIGLIGLAALGGVSGALWTADADIAGGQIESGKLDIKALDIKTQDVSSDRSDSPHDIDLSTWRAVPGDTVAITTPVDLELKGDNAVAEVKMDTSAVTNAIPEDARQYVTVTYKMTTADGSDVNADNGVYTVKSTDNPVGDYPTVPESFDGTADLNAVAEVHFSEDTPDRVLTESQLANLGNAKISLDQVRK